MRSAHDSGRPAPTVAELIRATTAELLVHAEELFEEVDTAVLASQPDTAVLDERVAAAIRASNHANLTHWAASNLRDPGARVAPLIGPETLEIAREVVRRGLDDNSLEAYRVGQNVAWRRWMTTAFAVASESGVAADTLRDMLDLSSRSIFGFVDETLATIHDAMEAERAQLVSRTPTERMEVVNLILEHAPITSERASRRLRYELARPHVAAIVWSDEIGPRDPSVLEAGAAAVTRAAGGTSPLTVVPSASALWAWFSTGPEPVEVEALRGTVRPAEGVRIALGTTDAGLDGFRRTHLRALATQALMRRMPHPVALAAYAEVELAALGTHDEEHAAEFVARTLGELSSGDPALRETLRVYLRHGRSATATARLLFTHRNTVQNRVARAEALLGVPLAEHGLEVGLALEIERWFGS